MEPAGDAASRTALPADGTCEWRFADVPSRVSGQGALVVGWYPMTPGRALESFADNVLGDDLAYRITLWDGSVIGSPSADLGVVIRNRRALRRLLWEPSALGLARAYVAGDLEVDGELSAALDAAEPFVERVQSVSRKRWYDVPRLLGVAARLGVIGRNPKPPLVEARLAGPPHSRQRDADAISHHYDLSNDFYRLLLGESMTYSCGYWQHRSSDLTGAQFAKCALVACKLGLQRDMRVLDVGCGWGTFAVHAARTYGAHVVGVTLSEAQASYARRRVDEAGVADCVEIRIQDYRDVADRPFDAVASIGMAEHVGAAQLPDYARALARLVAPGGRVVNHAIARPQMRRGRTSAFIDRYIFPDGELVPLSQMMAAFEEAGLEIRDVESLRDHYAPTLRAWTRNLEDHWSAVCDLVGTERARAWRLYLAGSALAFDRGRLAVHQLVVIKPAAGGNSRMPRSRAEWLGLSRVAL
jgi:cyclopropane-fatty-acyl-phospholipid synthase